MCQVCHRRKLHGRFANPLNWQVYCAHVSRGGYGRDLKKPEIKVELSKYQSELKFGNRPEPLPNIKGRNRRPKGWWTKLTCDREVLARFDSRARAINDAKRAPKRALPELSDEQIEIFRAHYKFPEKTASIPDIAEQLGTSSPQRVRDIYRRAGELMCEHSEYEPPKLASGGRRGRAPRTPSSKASTAACRVHRISRYGACPISA